MTVWVGGGFWFFSTHGCAFESDAVGVIYQAIEDGIGEGGIPYDFVPVLEG